MVAPVFDTLTIFTYLLVRSFRKSHRKLWEHSNPPRYLNVFYIDPTAEIDFLSNKFPTEATEKIYNFLYPAIPLSKSLLLYLLQKLSTILKLYCTYVDPEYRMPDNMTNVALVQVQNLCSSFAFVWLQTSLVQIEFQHNLFRKANCCFGLLDAHDYELPNEFTLGAVNWFTQDDILHLQIYKQGSSCRSLKLRKRVRSIYCNAYWNIHQIIPDEEVKFMRKLEKY